MLNLSLYSSYVARLHNGSYTSPGVDSNFEPIPGLQRPNADTYVIFLSPNEVDFTQPTSDPWYNSSQTELVLEEGAVASNDSSQDDPGYRMLLADEPASPLGCIYREQWCIPGLPAQKNCTPLVGTSQMPMELSSLVPDNATWNRIHWISGSMFRTQPIIYYVIFTLGGQSLTSRFTFLGNTQGFVAPDQWQQDVQYWNAITLAGIQQAFISTVVGDVADTPELSFTPSNEEDRVLCSSQVINTHWPSYTGSTTVSHKRGRQLEFYVHSSRIALSLTRLAYIFRKSSVATSYPSARLVSCSLAF